MAKYKLQFDARVFNPDTEEYITGWIDPARPFEVRELHTDVPTFEYATYDEAVEAVEDIMGEFEEEDRNGTTYFYAENSEQNLETGEDFTYGAHLDRPEPVPVQLTVDLMMEFKDDTTATRIASRIRELIQSEYMRDGEDLYGYDGPMVTKVSTEVAE